MKICIIGNEGSTGKRYSKILYTLGCDIIPYDLRHVNKGLKIPIADKYIVATPSDTHFEYAKILSNFDVPILLEKPAFTELRHYDMFPNYSVVCNWAYVFYGSPRMDIGSVKKLTYSNFYTGKENYWWNTWQLHMLRGYASKKDIKEEGSFIASIDGIYITLDMIEKSYSKMLLQWITINDLWKVKDCKEVHRKIINAKKRRFSIW